MNWLLAALIVAPLAGLAWFCTRAIHGRESGVTPLGAFLGSWTAATYLYVANPLGLYRLSAFGLWVVGLGIGCFIAGYAPVAIFLQRRHAPVDRAPTTSQEDEVRAIERIWIWCRRLWVPLFAVFLGQLDTYGARSLSGLLSVLRLDLTESGNAPLGFYFFYFAQVSVPFGAVLYFETRRRRYLWWTAAAMLALVFTSGRYNLLVALFSVLFIAVLWGRLHLTKRRVGLALIGLVTALAFFNYVGNGVGKTYENSQLFAKWGDRPPEPTFLMQGLFYVAGPLPYFGDLVRTSSENGSEHGANTARPFLQAASIVAPGIKPPAKIREFRAIPFDTNLGTYMAAPYRDFGVLGLAIVSGLFGFLSALSWAAWKRRDGPVALAVLSLVLVFCVGSVLDAGYTELWFVLFLALAWLASRRRRSRHGTDTSDELVEFGMLAR